MTLFNWICLFSVLVFMEAMPTAIFYYDEAGSVSGCLPIAGAPPVDQRIALESRGWKQILCSFVSILTHA